MALTRKVATMSDRYPDQECDSPLACSSLAVFNVYASHDTPRYGAGGGSARYTKPWARSCAEHLGALLHDDLNAQGSTHQWTIRTGATR